MIQLCLGLYWFSIAAIQITTNIVASNTLVYSLTLLASEGQVGLSAFSTRFAGGQNPGVSQVILFSGGSMEESTFRLMRNPVPWGWSTLSPQLLVTSLWFLLEILSIITEATMCRVLLLFESLHLLLLPSSVAFKSTCDCFEYTHIIQDSLLIIKSAKVPFTL